MRVRTSRRAWVVGLALLAGGPGSAYAQGYGGTGTVQSGTYGSSAGMLANPYANPYLNPFMNPYMTQANVGPRNTMLYMMAAQQMNGGLGSGQLSGTRPAASARKAPVHEPAVRAPGVPGGRTSRYFNRSYAERGGLSRHYGRQDSYFPRVR